SQAHDNKDANGRHKHWPSSNGCLQQCLRAATTRSEGRTAGIAKIASSDRFTCEQSDYGKPCPLSQPEWLEQLLLCGFERCTDDIHCGNRHSHLPLRTCARRLHLNRHRLPDRVI